MIGKRGQLAIADTLTQAARVGPPRIDGLGQMVKDRRLSALSLENGLSMGAACLRLSWVVPFVAYAAPDFPVY